MSGFKEILVCSDATENIEATLKTALLAARRFNSHIDAVHIHKEPTCVLPVPVVTSDMAGFVVNDVVTAEETALAETADKSRRIFEKFIEKEDIRPQAEPDLNSNEVTAEFRELYGSADEILSWASRVSDLTVLPRPDTSALSEDAFEMMNAVLMESGSAVLVSPLTAPVSLGNRIAVAWDASEEAAKAVTLAMPFLTRAEEVVILETDLPNETWADSRALARRLAWHGIKSEIVKIPETDSVSTKGAEIVRQACGRFDLLVTGAFTQSTMRRWILGSMTKYLIDNADIALFMTH